MDVIKSCLSCKLTKVYKSTSSERLLIIDCEGVEHIITLDPSTDEMAEFVESAKNCEKYEVAK